MLCVHCGVTKRHSDDGQLCIPCWLTAPNVYNCEPHVVDCDCWIAALRETEMLWVTQNQPVNGALTVPS